MERTQKVLMDTAWWNHTSGNKWRAEGWQQKFMWVHMTSELYEGNTAFFDKADYEVKYEEMKRELQDFVDRI